MHSQTVLCSFYLRHKYYNIIFKTKHVIYNLKVSPPHPTPTPYPLFLRDFQIITSYSGYAENRNFILIQKFLALAKGII